MPSLVGSLSHISLRAHHQWFYFYRKIKLAFERDPQLHHVLLEMSEVRVRRRWDPLPSNDVPPCGRPTRSY
jgi:hypothetical protein